MLCGALGPRAPTSAAPCPGAALGASPRPPAAARRARAARLRPAAAPPAGGGGASDSADPPPAPEPAPGAAAAMPLDEALALLGLQQGASYDAVLAARNRLEKRAGAGSPEFARIEAAYDAVLSSQLRARLAGSLAVSDRVRFADVAPPRRSGGRGSRSGGGGGGGRAAAPPALRLPGGAAVELRPLEGQPAAAAGAGYAALAAWTLAGALLNSSAAGSAPGAAAAADVPGLQLALGAGAAVYLLRDRKRAGLGKAALLALGGLIIGTLVGGAAESWLRVDLVPLGGLSSPGALVGEFGLAGLFAAAFFLA
jgi:hypothetical protein